LFKEAYIIIEKKEHLSIEGLEKLVFIKYFMNKGLSPELMDAFSHIKFKPLILEKNNLNQIIMPD
jgi:hypothetical protein